MTSLNLLAELDRVLADDPLAPRLEQLRAVAGDWLQSQGDARGELIALESALAPGRARNEGCRAILSRLCELEPKLGAQLQLLLPRANALELRGGHIAALRLDLRRERQQDAHVCARIDALGAQLCASPYGRHTRALHIRVRHVRQVALVLERLTLSAARLPLEVLSVSPTTRPLGHQTRGHALELRKTFPHLWLVTPFARVTPLIDPSLPDAAIAAALREQGAQVPSRDLRVRIGRGLSSGRKRTTLAACELLCELGPAGAVFLPVLDLLLRPQVSHAALWILTHLRRFGAWNTALLPRLQRMNGAAKHYPDEVRRLAGRCARSLEPAPQHTVHLFS